MSYFKAKMHQIRFRLGFRPKLRWGSSQRSLDPLAGFNLRGPTSKGREGRRGKGRGGRRGEEGRKRRGGGERRVGRRREEEGREGEGRGGKERPYTPLSQIPGYATDQFLPLICDLLFVLIPNSVVAQSSLP